VAAQLAISQEELSSVGIEHSVDAFADIPDILHWE
jgi:hypothetical protein